MKRNRPNPMGDTPTEQSFWMFKVMLDNYVDSIAFSLNYRKVDIDEFLHDLDNNPDWFDKWSEKLHMGTNLTVYGVSAMVLLKDYSKEKLDAIYRRRLPEGEIDLGSDDPQLPDKVG